MEKALMFIEVAHPEVCQAVKTNFVSHQVLEEQRMLVKETLAEARLPCAPVLLTFKGVWRPPERCSFGF